MGLNPLGASVGIPAGFGLAGIGLLSGGGTLPTGVTLPLADSATSEGNVIAAKAGVSVTPIAGVPDADPRFVGQLQRLLHQLSK